MRAPRERAARQKFSPEEDDRLRELVSRHGEHNWQVIAAELGRRAARRCKERWTHYLAPTIMRASWSVREDQLLDEKVAQLGKKWKLLEVYFPGRTDIGLKNRYNLLTRKRNKALKSVMHGWIRGRKHQDAAQDDDKAAFVEDDRDPNEPDVWVWHFELDPN
jgi:hypothetical protein